MIQLLRKKFIIINMFFVMSIMLIVLSVIFVSNYRSSTRNTSDFLNFTTERLIRQHNPSDKHMMDNPPEMDDLKPPEERDDENPLNILPGFAVQLDSNNNIIDQSYNGPNFEDVELDTIVNSALNIYNETGNVSGTLKEYKLKFIIKQSNDYTYIGFADYSFEEDNIQSLAVICIGIFLLSSVLFFMLSYFLSKWALAPTEKAWKQQTRFVADASHELKTPITVILANLSLLKAHPDSTVKEQSKWIDSTLEEASRMKQLISDLLTLARSDSSTSPLVMSDVDISDIVTSRVLNYESVAFENKIELNSDIENEIHMCGHDGELKQLVSILLDNACKYAGSGGKIDVSLKKTNNHIRLAVTNTGAAIPESDIPHIFERFYRPDVSRSRKDGGYGLGLSIAASIVKHHKGHISVESHEGFGTTFTVDF